MMMTLSGAQLYCLYGLTFDERSIKLHSATEKPKYLGFSVLVDSRRGKLEIWDKIIGFIVKVQNGHKKKQQ